MAVMVWGVCVCAKRVVGETWVHLGKERGEGKNEK